MKQTEDVKEIALDLQKWAMQMSDGGLTIFEALTIAVKIQKNIIIEKQNNPYAGTYSIVCKDDISIK